MSDKSSRNVEVRTRAAGKLVGLADNFTMETRSEIPKLWQRYFSRQFQWKDQTDPATYGVSFSVAADGGFRYGVGAQIDPVPQDLPEGACQMDLAAGEYAVLSVFGPVSELPANFDWMFSEWLPGSDFAQREGSVFERYPDDDRNGPDGMAYQIWVPVTAKA